MRHNCQRHPIFGLCKTEYCNVPLALLASFGIIWTCVLCLYMYVVYVYIVYDAIIYIYTHERQQQQPRTFTIQPHTFNLMCARARVHCAESAMLRTRWLAGCATDIIIWVFPHSQRTAAKRMWDFSHFILIFKMNIFNVCLFWLGAAWCVQHNFFFFFFFVLRADFLLYKIILHASSY